MKYDPEEFRNHWLKEKLPGYPSSPGCYLMRDAHQKVFYVGKAKDLRNRLRSYFTGGDPRFFVGCLVALLDNIEVIQVRSEKEALLLEKKLVRDLQPQFNILLKDDKDFIRLRIKKPKASDRLRQQYPRLEVVRKVEKDDSLYFGPFVSAGAARSTLRTINKYFQLRTCKDQVLENRSRPCLQYQIGRCPAPCVQPIKDYPKYIKQVELFLKGRLPELLEELNQNMWNASQREDYEAAARIRDQIKAIETNLEEQLVADENNQEDMDVIGTARGGAQLEIVRMAYRKGWLSGQSHYSFSRQAFPTEELLASVLAQVYEATDHQERALTVITDCNLGDDQWILENALAANTDAKKTKILHVHRGNKKKLVEIANQNAKTRLERHLRSKETHEQALVRLQKRLHLKQLPVHIECFDVSLFQGSTPVVSQVVFKNGKPDKSCYRQYNIKSVEGTDDYAMLAEAIGRRLKRGVANDNLPDLILVDGGKGQLHAAIKELKKTEALNHVPHPPMMAAIAKARDLGEERRGYAGQKNKHSESRSPERIFLPNAKDPIALRPHTSERFLVERIRDEAHRFAIQAHRRRRKKKTLASALDGIPGVGPKTKQNMLLHFGSAKNIKKASAAELQQVKGVGKELASTIYAHFHASTNATA
ncbi:MAG: excinuclease ABC subunit C [Myxococcales bacterium]|nr:excinuclease ABC subunit C [Myxococcales bacterium]